MKTPKTQFDFSRSILALAVLAAIGSAYAADDEVTRLTQPESTASAGLGGVTGNSKDRSIYGQYNGRRLYGSNFLLFRDSRNGDRHALKIRKVKSQPVICNAV